MIHINFTKTYTPPNSGAVALNFGETGGETSIDVAGTMFAVKSAPVFSAQCVYDSNVDRSLSNKVAMDYGDAGGAVSATDYGWGQAIATRNESDIVVNRALDNLSSCESAWGSVGFARDSASIAHQKSNQISAWKIVRFESLGIHSIKSSISHKKTMGIPASASVDWDTMFVRSRVTNSLWADGVSVLRDAAAKYSDAMNRLGSAVVRWDRSANPKHGGWFPVIAPKPEQHRCHEPPDPLNVVINFSDRVLGSKTLVFRCRGNSSFVLSIPSLRCYMITNQLSCVLLPSGDELDVIDLSIDADMTGYANTLTLNCAGSAFGLIQYKQHLQLTINGVDRLFIVETKSRQRRFGESSVRVVARSLSTLIYDQFGDNLSWVNGQDLTAQQIALKALEYTGFTLEWGIDDWLVPAGAWSHQGTPISAITRIADSVGAFVKTHHSLNKIYIQPRYKVKPWEISQAVVDLVLPMSFVTTESIDERETPAYNGVYVSGQNSGVLGFVRRSGTSGGVLAPMVTDALITHQTASMMRGIDVLGRSGKKAVIQLTTPIGQILDGPQVNPVELGEIVEASEGGVAWRGFVESTRIQASHKSSRQIITLERSL